MRDSTIARSRRADQTAPASERRPRVGGATARRTEPAWPGYDPRHPFRDSDDENAFWSAYHSTPSERAGAVRRELAAAARRILLLWSDVEALAMSRQVTEITDRARKEALDALFALHVTIEEELEAWEGGRNV